MRTTSNQKYEITEISHERYPFLHRIRALRDIGKKVKAGELYPEDYDFSIVFDSVENRKARHQMERKYMGDAEVRAEE